ncbi:MAG: hypothetical protein ACREA0_05675 [bacterium]
MSDAVVVGLFTLSSAFGAAAIAGYINYRLRKMDLAAEERRHKQERDARREERLAADIAEVRREGAAAFARAGSWLVDAHPDRLGFNLDRERWQETVVDLQNRLQALQEPLGVLAIRLPSRAGRDIASDFGVALSRVLNYDAWLLQLMVQYESYTDWREDS